MDENASAMLRNLKYHTKAALDTITAFNALYPTAALNMFESELRGHIKDCDFAEKVLSKEKDNNFFP